MAKAGEAKVDVSVRGLNLYGWRIAAKYGRWCQVLIERNKKLEHKLRIRSAKLGQARQDVVREAQEGARVITQLLQENRELRRELEEKNNVAG